jgi:hypothetical protein
MVRFRLKNQAARLVSRTRTAARNNIVQKPAWLGAANVTPPPPLPPARKVQRFNFPYQHLADDFARKNPAFKNDADRIARDQFALMSMNPKMKKQDALREILSKTKVKDGKLIFNSFNRKEWLSVGDSRKLHRMRRASERLHPFDVQQNRNDPIVDEQLRSGVIDKLRELNKRQEKKMRTLASHTIEEAKIDGKISTENVKGDDK